MTLTRTAALVVGLAMVAFASGCGVKGDPIAPSAQASP
jgi:hypothetical protein